MNPKLVRAKRVVVQLVRSLSRGRAVDILWWEPAEDVLTLYVEGRLEDGGTDRASHTFDRDTLARFTEPNVDGELRRQMYGIVARFSTRAAMPLEEGRRGGA